MYLSPRNLRTEAILWSQGDIKVFMMIRKVSKVVLSVEQSEGVGARVRRSIGRKEVRFILILASLLLRIWNACCCCCTIIILKCMIIVMHKINCFPAKESGPFLDAGWILYRQTSWFSWSSSPWIWDGKDYVFPSGKEAIISITFTLWINTLLRMEKATLVVKSMQSDEIKWSEWPANITSE